MNKSKYLKSSMGKMFFLKFKIKTVLKKEPKIMSAYHRPKKCPKNYLKGIKNS